MTDRGRALESTGITSPQFAALALLETTPGLSNAELARRNLVTPQTMNGIVQKLTRCVEHADAVEACMLSPLNAPERVRLLNYLNRVGDALASLSESEVQD